MSIKEPSLRKTEKFYTKLFLETISQIKIVLKNLNAGIHLLCDLVAYTKGLCGFFDILDLTMGHQVDAHAHESHVYYPEVRQRISDAGGSPTQVASGVNEDRMAEKMRMFDKCYPDFTILWGGGIPGHPAGECAAGWVWRPSRNDWTKHDPNGKYIFIGPGAYTNNLQFIRVAIKNRRPNQINTYALLITPRQLLALKGAEDIDEKWTVDKDNEDYWEKRVDYWDNLLSEIDVYVKKGLVEYVSLTEIAEIYKVNEDNINPDFGEIPRTRMSKMKRAILYE